VDPIGRFTWHDGDGQGQKNYTKLSIEGLFANFRGPTCELVPLPLSLESTDAAARANPPSAPGSFPAAHNNCMLELKSLIISIFIFIIFEKKEIFIF
jgi:hypothetical protein